MATLTRDFDVNNLCSRKLQALMHDAHLTPQQRRQIETELQARQYPVPAQVHLPQHQWPLTQ